MPDLEASAAGMGSVGITVLGMVPLHRALHVEYRLSEVGRSLSGALAVPDPVGGAEFPALDAARDRYNNDRATSSEISLETPSPSRDRATSA